MIEQVLMNVELGRYSPGDPNALAHLEELMLQGLVDHTEDGWRLTEQGLLALDGYGWRRAWCRFEPWGKGMRPGIFDTIEDARAADVRWCQIRGGQRALIRPVFVHDEARKLMA